MYVSYQGYPISPELCFLLLGVTVIAAVITFGSVVIAPNLGPLQRAEGKMPHPLGEIKVSLRRMGSDGVQARITLPDGLEGMFEWQGETIHLQSGQQEINRQAH